MEVKFRNNIILRRMEELGFKTVAELCRQAGLDNGQVGELINMKELPLNKKGSWRPVVTQLAEFFNCLPEDMFSEEQLETKLEKNRAFAEFTFGQVQTLIATNDATRLLPEKVAEESELKRLIAEMLGTLTKQEEKVIRARFGIGTKDDSTLEEVAVQFGLTRERIRQIEAKALRRLRQPPHSAYLRQFLENDDNEVSNHEAQATGLRYG